MADADHGDQQAIVLDPVQDPVVADTRPPHVVSSTQLDGVPARVLREPIDASRDASSNGELQLR